MSLLPVNFWSAANLWSQSGHLPWPSYPSEEHLETYTEFFTTPLAKFSVNGNFTGQLTLGWSKEALQGISLELLTKSSGVQEELQTKQISLFEIMRVTIKNFPQSILIKSLMLCCFKVLEVSEVFPFTPTEAEDVSVTQHFHHTLSTEILQFTKKRMWQKQFQTLPLKFPSIFFFLVFTHFSVLSGFAFCCCFVRNPPQKIK